MGPAGIPEKGRGESLAFAGSSRLGSDCGHTSALQKNEIRCGRPRSIAGPVCLRLRACARDSAADELSSIWRGGRLVEKKPALPTLQPLLSEDHTGGDR